MNNNYPNSNASRGSIDELIDLAKKEELNNNYFEAIRLYSLAIKKNNERSDNSYTSAWFLRGKLNLKISRYRAKYDLERRVNAKKIWNHYIKRFINLV